MEEKKHSGLGIASFITSIVSGLLIFLLIGVAGVMEASTPGGIDEESAGAVIVGLFLFAFLGAALVALGLGIAGLLQKERKKAFCYLGHCVLSCISCGHDLYHDHRVSNGMKPVAKMPNKALHRTAIPLCSIAAGELGR